MGPIGTKCNCEGFFTNEEASRSAGSTCRGDLYACNSEGCELKGEKGMKCDCEDFFLTKIGNYGEEEDEETVQVGGTLLSVLVERRTAMELVCSLTLAPVGGAIWILWILLVLGQ